MHRIILTSLMFISSLAHAKSFRQVYFGLLGGDLIQFYESQQIQLAEGQSLFSDHTNLSLERGGDFHLNHAWLKHTYCQSYAYSTFEIDQHGGSLAIRQRLHNDGQKKHEGMLGVASLYNSSARLWFWQAQMGYRTQGPITWQAMVTVPIQHHQSYASSLSQDLYQIAQGTRGNNLTTAQQQQVVQRILNQPVTDSSQVSTIYQAILALQQQATTNKTLNYSPIFSTYSNKTASLYQQSLDAANRAGNYDYIAQYGIHLIASKPGAYSTATLWLTPFAGLSIEEKQTLLSIGAECQDRSGYIKTVTPLLQIIAQDQNLNCNAAVSLRIYLERHKQYQLRYDPMARHALQGQVNFTQSSFQATNLNET